MFVFIFLDVCMWVSFEPICEDIGTLVIVEVLYGRMLQSWCINSNYYMDCTTDVTDLLSDYCQEQTRCVLLLPNSLFIDVNPCRQDLSVCLQVCYTCE